ncbi:MAG: hypothetical protein IKQ88_02955, partial [Lachnospiraceae bacterium]|nr:hypothetical protein [Lachnospiraceae bacterium]
MSSEEEYLDSLLAKALSPGGKNNTEAEPEEPKEPAVPKEPVKPVIEEEHQAAEDIAENTDPVPEDNAKEADDLIALLTDEEEGRTAADADGLDNEIEDLSELDLEDIEKRMAEAEAAGADPDGMISEDAELSELLES